jgi:hypothetical protein
MPVVAATAASTRVIRLIGPSFKTASSTSGEAP